VVGNSALHGSFDNFNNIINQSQYEERWYINVPTLEWVYYSKIVVDGKTIEYAWNGNILSGPTQPTGLFANSNDPVQLNLFPNPVNDALNIDLSPFQNKTANIRIHNMLGQEVYAFTTGNLNKPVEKINTANWNNGVYVLSIESEGILGNAKFTVQH
jgi:hypothetical protein